MKYDSFFSSHFSHIFSNKHWDENMLQIDPQKNRRTSIADAEASELRRKEINKFYCLENSEWAFHNFLLQQHLQNQSEEILQDPKRSEKRVAKKSGSVFDYTTAWGFKLENYLIKISKS